jgi:hypothetical protein
MNTVFTAIERSFDIPWATLTVVDASTSPHPLSPPHAGIFLGDKTVSPLHPHRQVTSFTATAAEMTKSTVRRQ